jgi:hypothetical protein
MSLPRRLAYLALTLSLIGCASSGDGDQGTGGTGGAQTTGTGGAWAPGTGGETGTGGKV